MYQAIVFLPLLGAILAGLIALAGARARFPGKGPAPGGEDHATDHGALHGDAGSHASHHAGEHAPAAVGSRTAELITTTLLMISMIRHGSHLWMSALRTTMRAFRCSRGWPRAI